MNFDLALEDLAGDAPLDKQNWDEVVDRARRSGRHHLALASAVVLLVILGLLPGVGLGSRVVGLFDGTPVAPDRLAAADLHALGAMANGVSPRIPASRAEDLGRAGASSLRQIATRGGRAYFVADLSSVGHCVAVGSTGDPNLFGALTCSSEFPSASRPILDASAFHGPASGPQVARLEGFAADGVAAVGVLLTDGTLDAVTPVTDNVYLRTDALPADSLAAIVALDRNERRIYVQCFAPQGCSS